MALAHKLRNTHCGFAATQAITPGPLNKRNKLCTAVTGA